MNIYQVAEAFLISALAAYLITPFVRTISVKLGYLDHPQDNKVHAHPTPLLGGVAIFIAFVIAVAAKIQTITLLPVQAILLGSTILFVIGLIDDKISLGPKFKLFGQFLAAIVIVKAGLMVDCIPNHYIKVIVTYIWIIGITNSFNLLDNMNGLSAGIAGIAALFFGVIAYINGQPVVTTFCLALSGSAFGFLRYNFPKASIFMGDTGSLVLGYVLSAVALLGIWKTESTYTSLMVPLLILGYPIFDTTLVSIMRTMEGRSVFQGGKDHSSHRLALLGFRRFKTVLLIYLICIILGIAAVVITKTKFVTGVALGMFILFCMAVLGIRLAMVDTKRFGRKRGVDWDE